jgi:hypothetical protein
MYMLKITGKLKNIQYLVNVVKIKEKLPYRVLVFIKVIYKLKIPCIVNSGKNQSNKFLIV